MKERDAGVPRRRRDLRKRLEELREERQISPGDAPVLPAALPPSRKADIGDESSRTTQPLADLPPESSSESITGTPPSPRPNPAQESFGSPTIRDRSREDSLAGGRASRADRWRRARRALAPETTTDSREDTPRSRAVPDPAELSVDEWIDPAAAAEDEFSAEFPEVSPFPSTVAYFDLETTGLGAHERVAISGTLRPEGSGLRLRQHLAFDAAQERAALEATLEDFCGVERLVTYNGKTFDLPFLRKRLAWHRLPPLPEELEHLDLLLEIRKTYRRLWSDCSLGTAEIELLKKRRLGPDVPGKEVPLRFADVCAGAPVSLLTPVIRHNRVDLTSLVALHFLRE